MSAVKEPNFFSKIQKIGPSIVFDDENLYLQLFTKGKGKSIIGEASTSYLYFKGTEDRIHGFNKESRIIIALRNPVERAYSHYLMDRDKYGREKYPVHKVLMDENYIPRYGFHGKMVNPYIYPSKYFDHVNRYIKRFGKEKVKVIFFEEMTDNQEKIFNDVFNFLGIKTININKASRLNEYKKFRSIWIAKANDFHMLSKIKTLIPRKVKYGLLNKLIYKNAQKNAIDNDLYRNIYLHHFKNDISNLENLLEREITKLWREDNDSKR